jgi:hypothetical protein
MNVEGIFIWRVTATRPCRNLPITPRLHARSTAKTCHAKSRNHPTYRVAGARRYADRAEAISLDAALFHCELRLRRKLPSGITRPLRWVGKDSSKAGSLWCGPVETTQGHPLILRFSHGYGLRPLTTVSLTSLPGTPFLVTRSSTQSCYSPSSCGPCALFPVR